MTVDFKERTAVLSEDGSVPGALATNSPPDDSGISGCVQD